MISVNKTPQFIDACKAVLEQRVEILSRYGNPCRINAGGKVRVMHNGKIVYYTL